MTNGNFEYNGKKYHTGISARRTSDGGDEYYEYQISCKGLTSVTGRGSTSQEGLKNAVELLKREIEARESGKERTAGEG